MEGQARIRPSELIWGRGCVEEKDLEALHLPRVRSLLEFGSSVVELAEASASFLSAGFAGSTCEENNDREDLVNRSGRWRFWSPPARVRSLWKLGQLWRRDSYWAVFAHLPTSLWRGRKGEVEEPGEVIGDCRGVRERKGAPASGVTALGWAPSSRQFRGDKET